MKEAAESDDSVVIKLEELDEDPIDLWMWPEWEGEECEDEDERGVPIGEPVIEDEERFMAVGGVVRWEGESGGEEDEEEGYDGDGEYEEVVVDWEEAVGGEDGDEVYEGGDEDSQFGDCSNCIILNF